MKFWPTARRNLWRKIEIHPGNKAQQKLHPKLWFCTFLRERSELQCVPRPFNLTNFLTETFQFSFHKEMGKISKIGKLCSWTPSNHYLSWSFIHSWIRTISKFLENDARSSSFFCKLSHENDQVKRGFGQWFLKVRLLAADSTEFSGSHSERH